MARPVLKSVCFLELSMSASSAHPSRGTVKAQHVVANVTTVHVEGLNGKQWDGHVTTNVSGDIWNAQVTRTNYKKGESNGYGTEQITVTVTNGDGDSNPVDTNSDVVP